MERRIDATGGMCLDGKGGGVSIFGIRIGVPFDQVQRRCNDIGSSNPVVERGKQRQETPEPEAPPPPAGTTRLKPPKDIGTPAWLDNEK